MHDCSPRRVPFWLKRVWRAVLRVKFLTRPQPPEILIVPTSLGIQERLLQIRADTDHYTDEFDPFRIQFFLVYIHTYHPLRLVPLRVNDSL